MGLLIDGQWLDRDGYETEKSEGRFERQEQAFRHWVTADGAAGPSGDAGFEASNGRYHLYVSLACPWAHRALIMRALKGLEAAVPVSVVDWYMGPEGWTFRTQHAGTTGDRLHGSARLYELYQRADPRFTGHVTVPVLWDTQTDTIVNNESSEIIRMLNSAFDGIGAAAGDYCPADRRNETDAINARVYETLNNGVYKAGFATTQAAYDNAIVPLFETLAWLESLLSERRYLTGDTLTEADIRLFTTLVRFDAVYVGHFKCNLRRLVDYPNLWGFTREIYQHPAIRPTVDFSHIKQHYYVSHEWMNPTQIVPAGPSIDFDSPHGRG